MANNLCLTYLLHKFADDIAGKNNDRKLNNKHGYPRQC